MVINCYLATQSYKGISVKDLEVNLKEMCLLVANHIPEESLCFDWDTFFKVPMKTGAVIEDGLFDIPDQQFLNQVFWVQKEKLCTFSSNDANGGSYNCFWGYLFSPRRENEFSVAIDYFNYRLKSIRESQTHETFWGLKHYLYPSLVFAESVADNIRQLKDDSLLVIIGGLERLEAISSKWNQGMITDIIPALNQFGKNYSGESESTRKDEKLMKLREFDFGGSRGVVCCEKHVKLSKFLRIHVYSDYNTRNICIGYAGPHLPTASEMH